MQFSARLASQSKRARSTRLPAAKPTPRHIAQYDFRRFNAMHNKGQPLQWPLENMRVTAFVRPEPNTKYETILAQQLKQPLFPISEVSEYLPHDCAPEGFGAENPKALMTFVGFHEDPLTKKLRRYFLKFPPHLAGAKKQARREVLFTYLMGESGEFQHVPVSGIIKLADSMCVIREYFDGEDGRIVLDEKVAVPEIPISTVVKHYALRYILFGDLDFHNPGNILFSESSTTPSSPTSNSSFNLLHIDGEGILPDTETIGLRVYDKTWTSGQSIPGTTAWRKELTRTLGANEFVKRTMEAENPLLGYLRRKMSIDEIKTLKLPREFIRETVASRPFYEQLIRTFEVIPTETLLANEADFQIVLSLWESCLEKNKEISMLNLMTGTY